MKILFKQTQHVNILHILTLSTKMWSINKLSMIKLSLFVQILLYLSPYSSGQPALTSRICQDTFGNYTSNSAFAKNLKTLLSDITSTNTKIQYGFYNFTVGKDLDVVNGLGMCRPDLSLDDCHQCLQRASSALVEQCPYQKDAIGWYETCMIRYTDRNIFGKMELSPWFHQQFDVFIVNKVKFNQTAANLLAKLQIEAASGDSRLKYAAGTTNVSSSFEIYALVQCTPDLDYFDCYNCLDNAIGFALTNLYGQLVRLSFVSCNIRFESFSFYDPSDLISVKPISLPPASSTSLKGKTKKAKTLIIILVPVVTSLILLFGFIAGYFMRRRARASMKKVPKGDERNSESLQMDFDTIKVATGNFSPTNQLGQGGFGTVYKGKLRNGQEIAVKRLNKKSGQGEEEFKNEALLVAKLRHRNLVRFLGFCLGGEERLLIYELLSNRSLDYFLFDPIKRSFLDWQTRYKIIGGIARGMLYLHEDSRLLIVHRDLKAANILLDEEMNPKITDFGMARLFGVDQTRANTGRICGTYGYMPPEYVQQGQFSIKSDVYSFGVLVLEIVSGLRITSFFNAETGESLLSYAWRNWLEGSALNIVDTCMSDVDRSEAMRCINIGLLCVQENLTHRPIMSSIILLLNSPYTIMPPIPSRPAFLLHYNGSEVVSSENEVTQSEFDPR